MGCFSTISLPATRISRSTRTASSCTTPGTLVTAPIGATGKMAERPVFVPDLIGPTLVRTWDVSFTWFAGMSVKQAQKSIDSLHETAKQRMKVDKVLEISSKSKDPLGVRLSAFNLMINTKKHNQKFSVECAYQSAKVFERGGPYKDLREMTSREAKLDPRLKESGRLVRFQFFEVEWAL